MSVGVIILLLVPQGDTQGPLVSGIVGAATRSLGADSRVLVDSRPQTSDEDAVALADRLHANAIVTMQWLEGGRVLLHAHWSGHAGWTDRLFTFKESDALDERGRTIGFTLASMVRSEIPSAVPAASHETRHDAAPNTAVAPTVAPAPWPSWRMSVEASGTMHLGSPAATMGGSLRGAVFVVPRLAVTAAAGLRAGGLDDTFDQMRFSLSGGVRIPLIEARAGRPYELTLLGEAIATRQTVSRTIADASARTESRWLPGAQLQVGLGWFFTSRIAAVAALGLQMDFGSTDIVVNGLTVTTLSPFRGTGELGARIRF